MTEMTEFIEAGYTTWGSYGQYHRIMLILRNGKLIDPAKIYSRRGDQYELMIEDVKAEVIDKSSRKNSHIYVRVPKDKVLAIVEDGATSSGWKGFKLYGPGEIVGVVKEETREFPERNRKIKRVYLIYIYRNEDYQIEIELMRRLMEETEELLNRPRVLITDKTTTIEVSGDTYYLRDILKSWGFRWDPTRKVWYRQALTSTKLTEFMSELGAKAEIEFKDEHKEIATTDEFAQDWNKW